MRLPFGDHAGSKLSAAFVFTKLSPDPSGWIVESWYVPPWGRWNTISSPSGDQFGSISSSAECVMFSRFEPFASITIRSWPLSPPLSYAIRVPSGDHVGNEAFAVSWVSRCVEVPSRFVT